MRRDSETPFSFLSAVSLWRAGCIVFLRRCSTRRTTMTQTVAVEIVWRNPKPPQRRQRWVMRNSASGHYLLQELISTPVGLFWATTSRLEILLGGRTALC